MFAATIRLDYQVCYWNLIRFAIEFDWSHLLPSGTFRSPIFEVLRIFILFFFFFDRH